MLEFRTPKMIERDKRDADIAAYFRAIQKNNPDVSRTRILKAMADEGKFGLKTPLAIRASLLRTGTIQVKAR